MVYIHTVFFICLSVSAKKRPGFLSQKPGRSYTLLVLSQALTPLLAGVLDCSLSSGEAGNGHTEGRAADVVQTNIVAELHARGIAAVLTADLLLMETEESALFFAGQRQIWQKEWKIQARLQ